MEAREITEKALEFFEDHEWIQEAAFQLPNGKTSTIPYNWHEVTGACLEGACYAVRDLPSLGFTTALCLMEIAATELFPDRKSSPDDPVYVFNDHLKTTREDAMLVLKHAIEAAK